MKQISNYLVIVFCFLTMTCQGQELKKEGFKIVEKHLDGESYISYNEISDEKYYPTPKDVQGKTLEHTLCELYSREMLDSLEKSIFSKTEIDQINSEFKCLAIFTISSSNGKIVNVTYTFTHREKSDNNLYPEIDLKKLKTYSQKIKECLNFKLGFFGDVHTQGYITQFYRIFVSTRNN